MWFRFFEEKEDNYRFKEEEITLFRVLCFFLTNTGQKKRYIDISVYIL